MYKIKVRYQKLEIENGCDQFNWMFPKDVSVLHTVEFWGCAM
jgi:hypothetical protein